MLFACRRVHVLPIAAMHSQSVCLSARAHGPLPLPPPPMNSIHSVGCASCRASTCVHRQACSAAGNGWHTRTCRATATNKQAKQPLAVRQSCRPGTARTRLVPQRPCTSARPSPPSPFGSTRACSASLHWRTDNAQARLRARRLRARVAEGLPAQSPPLPVLAFRPPCGLQDRAHHRGVTWVNTRYRSYYSAPLYHTAPHNAPTQ
jgi:hypothetical protein